MNSEIPFRLVKHVADPGFVKIKNDHLDLFLIPDGDAKLPTFEISDSADIEFLCDLLSKGVLENAKSNSEYFQREKGSIIHWKKSIIIETIADLNNSQTQTQSDIADTIDCNLQRHDSVQSLIENSPRIIQAMRKADHRRVYIDYSGPISNDRGHIKGIARGILRGNWDGRASICLNIKIPYDSQK